MSAAAKGSPITLAEREPSNDTRPIDPRRDHAEREPRELRRPSWPALKVSAQAEPSATHYRATMPLGTRRHADASRIADAFTQLVLSLVEGQADANDADDCSVVTSADQAGDAVIELRSRAGGIPRALVVGFLQPLFEVHAADRLEQGRALATADDLDVHVDVSVAKTGLGALLRVVLRSDVAGDRRSERSPSAAPDGPRRFDSGLRFRDASLLDLEEALAFAAGPS